MSGSCRKNDRSADAKVSPTSVFYRVLGRKDFEIGRVHDPQTAVKRGRFPRSRGPGDDENAVRPADDVVDAVEDIFGHSELGQLELHRRLVEDAQHDTFAELRRQGRDAQVNLSSAQRDLDAPVLRDAALGDVEVGEHLQPRGDRQRQRAGRRRHFVERTIDAVADLELVLKRLEVDVRSLVADGLANHEIYKPDDRRLFRHRLDVVGGEFAFVLREFARANFLQQVRDAGIVFAVMLANLDVDFLRVGQKQTNASAQGKSQVVHRVAVERIGRQQIDAKTIHSDRHDRIVPGQLSGQSRDRIAG